MPIVGDVIPGKVVLDSITKKAEQASNQHPTMTSISAPTSRFEFLG